MRLSYIKLAGFKSFVDPTIVKFNGNLSAVVGPNGCGKSNIMDAIRFVLGESSAKNLRGGQRTDVIFSGSSTRKPLGQASVELHFDNSDGTIGGEYSGFTEIAIRRQVTSDGQTTYFINGTKCRRRDVMDIFMGTGLGPRSYAIIEQGMISRFIEAKPEDLRVFLEEAAGISKYKERRRETENRIRHTRENLERLTDIREELEKQLNHLNRQAQAAEKFKILKGEEKTLSAQVAALSWQRLNQEVADIEDLVRKLTTELEAYQADLQHTETTLEKCRLHQHDLNDSLNQVQARYYSAGGEISRLEQTLEHHDERRHQLMRDHSEATQSLDEAKDLLGIDKTRIEELRESIVEAEPKYQELKIETEMLTEQQLEQEEALEAWREKWDILIGDLENANRQAEVEKAKVIQLETQMQQAAKRIARLSEEQQRLQAESDPAELQSMQLEVEELENIVANFDDKLQQTKQQRQDLSVERDTLKPELNRLQKTLQQVEGRKSSLEALQQAALGQDKGEVTDWLAKQALGEQKRLAQLITVDNAWSCAVETVFGDVLEAVWLDSDGAIESVADAIDTFAKGRVNFISPVLSDGVASSARPTLLDKVQSNSAELTKQTLAQFLGNIYLAQNAREGLKERANLKPHESIITPDGIWIGPGWMRIQKGENDSHSGILQREEELKELVNTLAELTATISDTQAKLKEIEDLLLDIETTRDREQMERNQSHRKLSELKAKMLAKKDRLDHMSDRLSQIKAEQVEVESGTTGSQEEIAQSRQIIAEAVEIIAEKSAEKAQLEQERQAFQQALRSCKDNLSLKRAEEHNLELDLQRFKTELESTISNIGRQEQQIEQLHDRIQNIVELQENNEAPVEELRFALEEKLTIRLEIETELNKARDAVAGIENEIRSLEQKRGGFDGSINSTRERLEKNKMQWQALSVHRENAQQKVKETDFELEELLKNMPEELTEDYCIERLTTIGNQIQRLGAINLAAIEEFDAQNERKIYLDAQDADLVEALTTLENAIEKIDRETRNRFKETFNAVNENFKVLFPKLFGGGQAHLGLVGDDLLEAGVTVLARPPGKRNSSIHQLSGGEKALTAVSLVFSIFHLNPAPFCLLDEVDAPLDDNNVQRFCNLVKEMSETVQFIYISHNKLALEMANELQGVTMKEPGVSRIVTVDIEKATEMATS